MDKKEELTQIVKTVQQDKGQFELLYTQIIKRVYFWCYTIIGDESEAKDATQEVIIRIYNKLDLVKEPEYFTSWMYKLVRNYCVNHLRKMSRMDSEYVYDEETGESSEVLIKEERADNLPPKAYDMNETKKILGEFIDNLPQRQREVIILYYLEEYKVEEIAKILDYNAGSVKSRLHAGRKNLEAKINKYQMKNNVTLYSISSLPALGMIISNYYSDIYNNQNLHFDKSIYNTGNAASVGASGTGGSSVVGSAIAAITSKVIVATILVVACVGAVAIIVSDTFSNKDVSTDTGFGLDVTAINNLKMHQKLKGNPYISNISYLEFPMRSSIDISIEMKLDVIDEEVKILYKDKELQFDKNGRNIKLSINENGVYTIVTEDHKTTFEIDNMDTYAPELTGVKNYGDYLELIINDELSQIDYEKSYIEYQGHKYAITSDLKVYGQFDGSGKVILVHQDGYFIEYTSNLK